MRATGRFPTAILSRHETLDPGERLTLILLYSLSEHDDLVAWTNPREMSQYCGYSVRWMQQHVKRLSEAGFISTVSKPDPRNRKHFRGYSLTMNLDGKPRSMTA